MEFEWDPNKAVGNLRKRGVSSEEAATTLVDPLSVVVSDPDHSAQCVNLVPSSGQPGEFYPIDYPIYDPTPEGKTKNDHLREMLFRTLADKRIQARTILFDSWYEGADNFKLIHPVRPSASPNY